MKIRQYNFRFRNHSNKHKSFLFFPSFFSFLPSSTSFPPLWSDDENQGRPGFKHQKMLWFWFLVTNFMKIPTILSFIFFTPQDVQTETRRAQGDCERRSSSNRQVHAPFSSTLNRCIIYAYCSHSASFLTGNTKVLRGHHTER